MTKAKAQIECGLELRLCISKAHLAGVTNTNAEGVAFLTPAGVLLLMQRLQLKLMLTLSLVLWSCSTPATPSTMLYLAHWGRTLTC